MLSIKDEELVTLGHIASLIPGQSGKNGTSYHTIYTWATSGVKGVKLETRMIGGRRFSTIEALDRFIEATNPQKKTSPIRQSKSKRISAAKKRLLQHGI